VSRIVSSPNHAANALATTLGLAWLLMLAAPAEAARFHVCTLSFNSPQELATIRSYLPAEDFEIIDLSPRSLTASEPGAANRVISFDDTEPTDANEPSWLVRQCRPDLHCDIVVVSGEFAGGFFGSNGTSVRVQDLEEASCQPECQGLFHEAREVFLLGCNTLATKAHDQRTPSEYLRVLLDHGFGLASAERVVNLRYGPMGPSFRESLRRVFMGVPRIYGFSSVAPRAEWTAPRLDRYFRAKGNYRRYLEEAGRQDTQNLDFLRAFEGSSAVQMPGLTPQEPGAVGRSMICGLYDESQPVMRGLSTIQQVLAEGDILSYLPAMEVFLDRHPPQQFRGSEKSLFDQIRKERTAGRQVLDLVHNLDLSAEKIQMAHLARRLDWLDAGDFHRLVIDSVKKMLAQPLSWDVVDAMCAITRDEPIGAAFDADDLPQPLFADADWYRLVDCIAPADQRVNQRLVRGLSSSDLSTRLWASYALSRRLPLDDQTLTELTAHLRDESPDVRARLQWIFTTQKGLSPDVRKAVLAGDPELAGIL